MGVDIICYVVYVCQFLAGLDQNCMGKLDFATFFTCKIDAILQDFQ